jgi:hypothetical protein
VFWVAQETVYGVMRSHINIFKLSALIGILHLVDTKSTVSETGSILFHCLLSTAKQLLIRVSRYLENRHHSHTSHSIAYPP